MATIRSLLAEGRRRLGDARVEQPGRESALLLARLAGVSEAALWSRDDSTIAPALADRYTQLLERRAAGEPFAYLFGEREFYGRSFVVDSRVLVPRPETEHLIETALALSLPDAASILDVGTGSGAIAVTLALERPRWRIVGSDRSLAALPVARVNARRHRVAGRLPLVAADGLASFRIDRFDLVVSNPPYVAQRDAANLPKDVVDFEPHEALFAGEDGLQLIERLIDAATGLRPGAFLALEIGAGQLDSVVALAAERGVLELDRTVSDGAGIPRDVVFRRCD